MISDETYTFDRDAKDNGEPSEEDKKMQDALSSAIVREKPNVKWSDVAGLDQAKASL
jgi:vacuolar protein-sorting-associated protein 4